MPRRMSQDVLRALTENIVSLYKSQRTKVKVVFHGGEPLLFGIARLHECIAEIVRKVPDVALSIQTNGTIFNAELENLLLRFRTNLTFSVSVDGFAAENDKHRKGLRNRSVYDQIEGTLKRARQAGVLDGVLIVVDPDNDPARIYEFMRATGARRYNVLLRDGDYDHPPPGKQDHDSTSVGEWLWELFCLYASGPQDIRITFFDDVAGSLLKRARGLRGPAATYSLCTLTVDTNGEVKQADTFRINGQGADNLIGQSILNAQLLELANSTANREIVEATETLCERCMACKFLDTCGGGYPSHRARRRNFMRPSIYCSDYLHLFERMEQALCQ